MKLTSKDVSTFLNVERNYSRMQFGKYKGDPLTDVPTDYLEWAANSADSPDLTARDYMRDELTRRKSTNHTS